MLKQFLLAGVLAGACGAALAGHPGRGGLFENADANADGSIARDEFLAARAAAFAKLDQNGDGVLDDADKRERTHEGPRREGLRGRLDANADGKISKEEFVNSATPMFDGADKDGNASDNVEPCKSIELKPPRALLMLVIDNTTKHDAFFKEACRRALEGIVSKRRDRPYEPGRGQSWRKVKCVREQEFVVGGFTEPKGARTGLGALLLGVHERDGTLVYAGRVGTGFTEASATQLRRRLDRLRTRDSPFGLRPPGAAEAHWVKPELVAQVSFTEWTDDGRLRHPAFKGLREDKPAREVVRERPRPVRGAGSLGARPRRQVRS